MMTGKITEYPLAVRIVESDEALTVLCAMDIITQNPKIQIKNLGNALAEADCLFEVNLSVQKQRSKNMKIINKIKAFFLHQEEPVELDLIAAEIKEGKAFLHPRGEESVTYLVRSDDIEITLSKGRSLSPKDIFKTGPKPKAPEKDAKKETNKDPMQPSEKDPKNDRKSTLPMETVQTSTDEFDRFKKRKFVVSLYPDEYDAIMSSMKEYGYKRADFVLACVNSAAKGTMEKAHKKIVKSHNDIRKEQQALYAKRQIEN